MMKKVVILISIFLIFSCECVEDINTPKIIEPEEAANVAFINAITGNEIINISSNEVSVKENLAYTDANITWSKVASGNTFIKVINSATQTGILNFTAEFEKKVYYTVIFYSFKSRIIPLIIKENPELKTRNSVRLVNAAEITDRNMEFFLSSQDSSVELAVGEYSEILPFTESEFSIKVYENFNNSLVCQSDNSLSGYQINILLGKNLSECELRAYNIK